MRIVMSLALLLIGASCLSAQAQVSAAQEAAARRQIENAARAADAKATEQLKQLNAGNPAAKDKVAVPLFNVEALPKPITTIPSSKSLDIEQLAQSMQGKSQLPSPPTLIAFVSVSMPKPSLDRLLSDAERYGATVIIRGMVGGSIPTTAELVQKLLAGRQIAWNIDPEAFKRYRISSVPAYVLVKGGSEASTACEDGMQCFAEADYLKLSGDVPLRFALEQFATQQRFVPDISSFEKRRTP
jgi:conjugal transfer pilus assembly protein TrbC